MLRRLVETHQHIPLELRTGSYGERGTQKSGTLSAREVSGLGPILKGIQPNLSKRGCSSWCFSLLTTPVLTSQALSPMAVLCLAPCPLAQQPSLLAWPLGLAWLPLPAVLDTLLASSHALGHKQPTRTPCLLSGQSTWVLSGRHTQINRPRVTPVLQPSNPWESFPRDLPAMLCLQTFQVPKSLLMQSQACFSPKQGCLLPEKSDVS